MARRHDVSPPNPALIRRPGRFGWLDDRLLRDDWLGRLDPETISVLVLLALAADRNGCSFYGRERMAAVLGMPRHDVDQALHRLLDLQLVAHRPWRPGLADGIWQLLPMPVPPEPRTPRRRATPPDGHDDDRPQTDAASIGEVIKALRLARQRVAPAPPPSPNNRTP